MFDNAINLLKIITHTLKMEEFYGMSTLPQ